MEARAATTKDADVVAHLLHDFNVEFASPSPGPAVLAARLRVLLSQPTTTALLAGDPAVGVAVVSWRTSVWYAGPVALLEELYVRPDLRDRRIGSTLMERLLDDAAAAGAAMVEINVDEGDVDTLRFYAHHGFTRTEPGSDERALYVWREL